MRRVLRMLTAALVSVVFVLAGQAVAQAQSTQPDGAAGGGDKVIAVIKHAGTDGPSTNANCGITRYGYSGVRICEFDYFDRVWSSGNIETFVVGSNYAIWHIWAGSGGWRTLGGQARVQTPNGALPSNVYLGVRTVGTDHFWWCRYWSATAWSPWQRCV
jgi:hypothetical protein